MHRKYLLIGSTLCLSMTTNIHIRTVSKVKALFPNALSFPTNIIYAQDVSKELEIINFRVLREVQDEYLKQDFKSWVVNALDVKKDEFTFNCKEGKAKNDKDKQKTQFRSFQKAMKVLLVFGQYIGLNPVTNITGKDVSKIRFVVLSWISFYSIVIWIIQTIVMCLCLNILFRTPVSIRSLVYVSFYSTISSNTFIFIRIATKWNNLVKEIFNCNLDEYVDHGMIRKVKIICVFILVLATIEHILIMTSRLVQIYECGAYEHSLYEELTKLTFPWLFDIGVPYYWPLGILLQLMNIIAAMNYNYSDVFIVCTSLYLTSILNQINKKIMWAAEKNYVSPSIWGTLREDFTRATRLVRLFDEVFSGLILVSFASNLFFICLQLFNILTNGIQPKHMLAATCPNLSNGFLRDYVYPLHLTYALLFLFARFLTVALVAASVNVASMVPAPALYAIPSYAYCKEVQRFLDQVHGDFVALSGLDFFYITRDLVLTVAGTIVTYELVLLQFNNEDLNKA